MGRISRGRALEDERLREVFLPMDRQQLAPSEISDELIPVYPYPTGTLRFDDARASIVTGAAGVTSVDSIFVPTGFYWWVLAVAMHHNDPVSRTMELFLRTAAPQNFGLPHHFADVAVPTAVMSSYTGPRLLLSEGMRLRAFVAALAAGQTVTIRVLFFEYRLAELSPWA